MKTLRCGGCGNDTVKLTSDQSECCAVIEAECTQCKSKTRITVSSIMKLDWTENAAGRLTHFSKD